MYLKFYGLKEKPFESVPDPKYFYPSPKHKRALHYLEYAFLNRAGLILITGDPGTGKTLLIKKFLSQVPKEDVAFITNTNVTSLELIQTIFHAFNLYYEPHETKAQLLDRFKKFLLDRHLRNKQAVIIIDEAQNLNFELLEEIRMLSNLQEDSHNLLQLILVGQPLLRKRVEHDSLRQLKQRIFLSYHLKPLDLEETSDYIRYRLSVAGAQNPNIFSQQAVKVIHVHSQGIPRLINSLCEASLVYGFADEKRIIDEKLVKEVIEELFSSDVDTNAIGEVNSGLCEINTDHKLQEIEERLNLLEKNLGLLVEKLNLFFDKFDSILGKFLEDKNK